MSDATRAAAAPHDQEGFRGLVEPHRGALLAHCYRMLGSPQDAEDALQDTLLRAWRGLSRFRADAPIRPWLVRIATNVCLDALARRAPRQVVLAGRRPARPGEGPGAPLVESIWLEPFPDHLHDLGDTAPEPGARYEERESLELAFVAALQHLPPRQRAVLVLRDVLGYSAREVAGFLDATTASVNSALQRARGTLAERLPDRSQQATLRALGDAGVREVVERYVAAWERHDVDAIRAMLVEDAIFAMPPFTEWWHGRDAVAALFAGAGGLGLRHRPVRANGQPAIAWYVREPDGSFRASSLEVLTFDGPRIGQITAFVLPALFPSFGVPMSLAAGAGSSR